MNAYYPSKIFPLGYSDQMAQRFIWVHGLPDIEKFGGIHRILHGRV